MQLVSLNLNDLIKGRFASNISFKSQISCWNTSGEIGRLNIKLHMR